MQDQEKKKVTEEAASIFRSATKRTVSLAVSVVEQPAASSDKEKPAPTKGGAVFYEGKLLDAKDIDCTSSAHLVTGTIPSSSSSSSS